jgi:sodium pump decarboxylase gamma subunit
MNELLQTGLNLTAIGMGVVFVLLTLLVGIIRGMSALSRTLEAAFPAAPAPASASASPPPAATPGSPGQQELVGVISAAIAAHRRRR